MGESADAGERGERRGEGEAGWDGGAPFVRESMTPADSRYFRNASFFCSVA